MVIGQFKINPIYDEHHECVGLDIINTNQKPLLADNESSNNIRVYIEEFDD